MSILLGILTFILILVSIFLVLVVLMQKSKDGGIGAALGGGATEAAFGADTTNVLTQATKYSAILFFVLAFTLYLGRLYERNHAAATGGALPNISVPAVPATPAPVAPATGDAAAPSTGTTPAPGGPAPAVSFPTSTPATATPEASTTVPATPAPAPTTPAPEPKK
jgi:preprotein translocase subunit SecG